MSPLAPITQAVGPSELRLLCDLERVVDLDAEIANRALYLGVAQQELDGAKVLCSPVDERRLGPPYRMRSVSRGVEA